MILMLSCPWVPSSRCPLNWGLASMACSWALWDLSVWILSNYLFLSWSLLAQWVCVFLATQGVYLMYLPSSVSHRDVLALSLKV